MPRLTLNLNLTRFINLSTTDWIICGRGAKNGLSLILPSIGLSDVDQNKGVKWLLSQQAAQWERLGYTPVTSYSNSGNEVRPGMDIVDVENSLCLWQKYARVSRGEELARARRL